ATKEVAAATVTDGVITVTFANGIANATGAEVDGKKFTLTASNTANQTALTWKIENIDVANKAAIGAIVKNTFGT
ncbi:MAG: precorrin-2 dehydrogenase, partial [Burkholderia sp.]|nr:precorrin-2 dehydrogenase [Burkholderia sp.]